MNTNNANMKKISMYVNGNWVGVMDLVWVDRDERWQVVEPSPLAQVYGFHKVQKKICNEIKKRILAGRTGNGSFKDSHGVNWRWTIRSC